MKTLIVEDSFTSRLLLKELLKSYGSADLAVNGREAVEAMRLAMEAVEPYDLICMDIMMPEMDGHEALREIRRMESAAGVAESKHTKIVMTSALADQDNVLKAIRGKSDCFLTKPIQKVKLLEALRKLALIT
jgi:two-component system chemotaxis response regulator CheY